MRPKEHRIESAPSHHLSRKKLSIGRQKPINTIPNEFLFFLCSRKNAFSFSIPFARQITTMSAQKQMFYSFFFCAFVWKLHQHTRMLHYDREYSAVAELEQTKETTFRRIKNNKIISNTNWIYIWLHTNGTKILMAFRPQIHNGNRWIWTITMCVFASDGGTCWCCAKTMERKKKKRALIKWQINIMLVNYYYYCCCHSMHGSFTSELFLVRALRAWNGCCECAGEW